MQEIGVDIPIAESPAGEEPLTVSGQLALFSPFEILQISHQSRKHGRLEIIRDDGLPAECRIGDGGILEARCGHRREREAVLTFVWWRKGTFKFIGETNPGPVRKPDRIPLKIPELMMEAVFMADEIEHRSQYIPLPQSPLSLKGDKAPEDELNCRIGDVFDYIMAHPGATIAEMDETLPLAPTQVRLSLALLGQSGLLQILSPDAAPVEGVVPRNLRYWYSVNRIVEEETVPATLIWWYRLTRRFPGGIRLLVAAAPDECTELIWDLVNKLAKMMEVPAPNVMCSSTGPSFARLHAPCGGVLSLTILPLTKKNRYLFESFVRSMQACFLCCDDRAAAEAQSWKLLIPPNLPQHFLKGRSALYDVLCEQMKEMSGAIPDPGK
jgi:hypothetical protein